MLSTTSDHFTIYENGTWINHTLTGMTFNWKMEGGCLYFKGSADLTWKLESGPGAINWQKLVWKLIDEIATDSLLCE
jgi:hypothetical protein